MEFRYLPMTEQDLSNMLETVGVDSTDGLFADIPEKVRMREKLNLKKPADEHQLTKELVQLAKKNINLRTHVSFLGAGVYDHYIPSIVDHIISRSEFYTAYTPYQPEISQGELQAVFEFQTMIAELTGMEVANSSMYDGATALAEAVNLSGVQSKKKKILLSKAIHPELSEVVHVYAAAAGLQVVEIGQVNGLTDLVVLEKEADEEIASIVIQYPNFYGQIEPLKKVKQLAEQKKAMMIVSSNPLALGYLTPPGKFGADIVVGDTQVFGIPAQFGGPHCGYFAVNSELTRKLPGRLVGQATDQEGRRGFVLTLQTREQHIRRDKATSNICSNQALNALASSVAISALGRQGVKRIAWLNIQKTLYAKKAFEKRKIEIVHQGPVFNEFVIKVNMSVSELNRKLLHKGYIGGLDLSLFQKEMEGHMLVAVTELRTREEIDQFTKEIQKVVNENE